MRMRIQAILTCVIILLAIAASAGFPAPAIAADDLDALVRTESTTAMRVFGIRTTLNLSASGPINSSPTNGLSIGLDGLRRSLAPVAPELQRSTVQFIVAHELWHQVQFRDYGADILNQDLETTRLYECQADLMGAHYVLSSLGTNMIERGKQASDATVNFAASIGMPRHSASDHPSEAQRRVAAQFGMTLAVKDYLGQIAPTEEISIAKQVISSILNFQPGEINNDWSLRQCKRIVQYRRSAVAAIVADHATINWSTSAENPIVQFSIPYRNVGNSLLRVSLEVVSAMVPRDDATNVAKRVRIDTLNQTFDIGPGQVHVVSGILRWYRTEDTMPKLLFPPRDDGGLLAAELVAAPVAQQESWSLPANLSMHASAFARVIRRLIQCSPNGFQQCRADAGQNVVDTLYFASTQSVPGATETQIVVEKNGSASIDAVLYEGSSIEAAKATYKQYTTDLEAIFPTLRGIEKASRTSGLPRFEMNLQRQADFEIYIYQNRSGKFIVHFTLVPTIL